MNKQELFAIIKGGLIVSCQAQPGEPLYLGPENSIMYLMARAAKMGGACAIRTESIKDVKAIKAETGLPVIGLIKAHYDGYDSYITPTMKEVDALMDAGAEIIAVDLTQRKRGDGKSAAEYAKEIRQRYPDIILMADIATYEEGIIAQQAGADLVSTTMSGYTRDTAGRKGPDYRLMKRLAAELTIPVIGEGRIHSPAQAKRALRQGIWAVVVGGAITRPLEITRRFADAVASV